MALDPSKLNDRYLGYLEPFTQFLILTIEAFRALVDPDASKTAVRKVPKRLKYSGWLQEIVLPRDGPGYMLTPRAIRALGLPERKKPKTGHSVLIQHLGLLYACLTADIDKHSVDSLRATHPELFCRGLPSGNYGIDADGRLVWLHVSHGGLPHNLALKAADIVFKRNAVGGIRKRIDNGEFGVVVAVPSDEVATAFVAALGPLNINPKVSVRPVCVPQLAHLLLTRSHHAR